MAAKSRIVSDAAVLVFFPCSAAISLPMRGKRFTGKKGKATESFEEKKEEEA